MKKTFRLFFSGTLIVTLLILDGCKCEPATEAELPEPVRESRELAPHPQSISVRETAQSIIIPDLVLPGNDVDEAVMELHKRSVAEDGHGFSFVIRTPSDWEYRTPSSIAPLNLGDISFFDAVEAMCLHYNASFQFQEFAVCILPYQTSKQ